MEIKIDEEEAIDILEKIISKHEQECIKSD